MTDSGSPVYRPILLTSPADRRVFAPFGRGGESARLPSRGRQAQRLTPRFDALITALELQRVTAQTSLPANDPELVLVFETRGSVSEVFEAARRAGLELLIEVEDEFEPDDDFQKNAVNPAAVPGFLHIALASLGATNQLRQLWETWSRGEPLVGLGGRASGLASLFNHLQDVRPWGPGDRVRSTGLLDAIEDRLAMGVQEVSIEAELWFYDSVSRRSAAETAVRQAIGELGGRVTQSAIHEEFGYHGVAAVIPTDALRVVTEQGPEAIRLLRSHEIFVVRSGGQSVLPAEEDAEPGRPSSDEAPKPTGDPRVLLLDGLPAVNHVRLDGRVEVMDPDGIDDGTYEAQLRRHGTEMASLIAWGDLGADEEPLIHPILARPILKPDAETLHNDESVPDGMLLPDLMVRVFREIAANSPSIRIVNLSVCDPHAPFETIPSGWARALDWLTAEYGVLTVVSAGNHSAVELAVSRATFDAAQNGDRRQWTLEALSMDALSRRLLTPAESINSLTVGALHSDAAGAYVVGQRIDLLEDAAIPSPVSAIGRGFRRSVKPEVHAPGGRQLFGIDLAAPATTTTRLLPANGILPPGLCAASPMPSDPTNGEVHIRGTSGAAALTTRRAARLLDLIETLRDGVAGFEDRHTAAALKALVVHGAEWPNLNLVSGVNDALSADRFFTYGWLATDPSVGCPPHRVTVLAVGDLAARQEEDITIPLPPSLSGLVGKRRITATLAWLSPTNWRHRQYRRAKLMFGKPSGVLNPVVKSKQVGSQRAQRGTVQHQIFEGSGAVPISLEDDVQVTVQCTEQAGGLNGQSVPYAVVVSFEVAEALGVDVYSEVASRIQPPVRVAARP